jgi:hypothetical protein
MIEQMLGVYTCLISLIYIYEHMKKIYNSYVTILVIVQTANMLSPYTVIVFKPQLQRCITETCKLFHFTTFHG